MPFIDLYSSNDYASIFYTTNTQHQNVGGFDPEKPCIVILHPIFLDVTWVAAQLSDPRLSKSYNMIAFDLRTSGRSTCRSNGRHDSWVDAADLALCFQKLHLPPSHILCLEGTSIYCAVRFAVLFPELCLSLTLVNVPAPIELKKTYEKLDQLISTACFADSLETFELAASEVVEFLFGDEVDPDLVDDIVVYWKNKMNPRKRIRVAETTSLYLNRAPMSAQTYAMITQPVLIVHGDKNQLCPLKYANRLLSQFTGVADGGVLYEVKGGRSMISVVPGYSSIVNNVFAKFLSRLAPSRSDIVPPSMSMRERMRLALNKLGEITGSDTSSLDPMCSLSFSCVSSDVVHSQIKLLKHYQKGIDQAFAPDPQDNWRRSSRKIQTRTHWSYADQGRGSVASQLDLIVHDGDDDSETLASEPAEQLSPTEQHSIKTTFYSGSTAVVKKTKIKVI